MSKQQAERLIVISLVVMLASTVGGSLASGQSGTKYYGRKIVGGFLTIFFASLAAELAPEVGALLAISTASYAFLHYGLPAINKGTVASNKKAAAEHKEPGAATPVTPTQGTFV